MPCWELQAPSAGRMQQKPWAADDQLGFAQQGSRVCPFGQKLGLAEEVVWLEADCARANGDEKGGMEV